MDVDAALAEVRLRVAGRTYSQGQPRFADEVLAEEVEALRAKLHATTQEALRAEKERDELMAATKSAFEKLRNCDYVAARADLVLAMSNVENGD